MRSSVSYVRRSGRNLRMVRGDIYFMDLVPRSGSEQTGRRPCILLSHDAFTANPRWRSVAFDYVPFIKRWFGIKVLEVSGHFAIIRGSHPTEPRLVAGNREDLGLIGAMTLGFTNSNYSNVRVGDGLLFVSTYPYGFPRSKLFAFDLDDPVHPRRFRKALAPGRQREFTSLGNTVYVSTSSTSNSSGCQAALTAMRVSVRRGVFR